MAYIGDGVEGQVENESYCMKKSWEARNNASTNDMMGYHKMNDRANVEHPPVRMVAKHDNRQDGPEAANNLYDY